MKAILIAFLFLMVAFVQTVVCDVEAGQEAKVIDVINGTTLTVSYAGNPVSCVYIGVSVPESDNFLRSTGSTWFNRDLVAGKTVRLEFDEQEYDKYGRLLAYVYCDDVFVNAELIRQGYASVMIVSPNTKHAELFLRLENEAREAKRGLWAESGAMDVSTHSVAVLEKRIALMARRIDDLNSKLDQLSSRMDQLLEIINAIVKQSQPQQEETSVDTTAEPSDEMVYATKSGAKYHKMGCAHLRGNHRSMTVKAAKESGLEPCSRCFPEEGK